MFYNGKKKLNTLSVTATDSKMLKKIKYTNIIKDLFLKTLKDPYFLNKDYVFDTMFSRYYIICVYIL